MDTSEGFEFYGVWITDRTKSPCGRFDLTPEQAAELYGRVSDETTGLQTTTTAS